MIDPALDEVLDRSTELTRAGRHEEHLALMREALVQHPDELEIVIRAAGAHIAEAPEEAAEMARAAVELAPEDPATLTRATSVMFYVDRLEEAREFFSRAARRADDDFALVADLVYLGGQIVFEQGDVAKAQELFEIAFDAQPESPGHGFALAAVLDQRGETERALEVAEEALRHRPGDLALEDIRLRLVVALYEVDSLPPGYTVEHD